MKYILKDEQGRVIAASDERFNENYELSEEEYEVGFDGRIYSATEMLGAEYQARKAAYEEQQTLIALRYRRSEECFPIVNRGALWYDKLTEEQKAELSEWYEAWLDAPQTGSAPDRPAWLDESL